MQLLTFTLGDTQYGIELEYVQSIEQIMQVVSIPNTLPYVKGIMNLHGEIIPVYSLAVRFGLPEVGTENIVVVDAGDMKIGLEVYKVQEILNISGEHVYEMPKIVRYSQDCFSEVADNQKHLIVTLDLKSLITPEERENMQEMVANNKDM